MRGIQITGDDDSVITLIDMTIIPRTFSFYDEVLKMIMMYVCDASGSRTQEHANWKIENHRMKPSNHMQSFPIGKTNSTILSSLSVLRCGWISSIIFSARLATNMLLM